MKATLTALSGAFALALIAGCDDDPAAPAAAAGSTPTVSTAPADVGLLPERGGEVPTMRLAEDVTPPTNRWYSSLVFGEGSLPVFPKPLSVRPIDGGFSMGLTVPTASADAILAPAMDDVTVTIAGASGLGEVVAADPVGASLSWGEASLELAQGWPVAGVSAAGAVDVSLSVPFTEAEDGVWTASVGSSVYGAVVHSGTFDGSTAALEAGGSLQLFAVPEDGNAVDFAQALGEVASARTWEGTVTADAAVTSVGYGTSTVVTMPTARAEAAGLTCDLGTYATIDGEFAVCASDTVQWSVPLVSPAGTLDVSALSDSETEAVREALLLEAASLEPLPADTYFGGKALYRIANLLLVAEALGEDATAASLQDTLATELKMWGDPERCENEDARCFTYDPVIKGVAGHTPSFGSEEFNDHHFHYGYLLYAAAIAGERDPALADEIGPVFDLVALDIAGRGDTALPPIRVFDPVAGHSWASGYVPFADGNNQESSSEAVSAWNGVALWAAVRADEALEQRATWLLSAEADAAARLWLAPDLTDFPEYEHSIVALEWGAKRDYATWFSPEPAAMLGIELIPVPPMAAATLGAVPADQIVGSVAEAAPDGYDVQFGDYLLMYLALAGDNQRAQAWEAAQSLPDDVIDDGNSRAYMLAWIAGA
ncbi:glycosyl hydrolase [Demequina sp.]|uniref:glycosyl hydrolase n=1 Tax=Demequina sp. TaxID=2050685 RepID=UPI003A88EE68